MIGKFGCKGYDTFGPFKLVGGIAKGHTDEEDIKNAKCFIHIEYYFFRYDNLGKALINELRKKVS